MPAPDAPHSARRTDIELLRVFAVIGVMLFHFDPGFTLAPNGYLGVDVFFTISGFVITQQMLGAHSRGSLTYAWFLARRVRRLLPSAVLVIAVTGVAMLVLADRAYLKDQAPAGVAALLYVSNFYFAAQAVDYFGGAVDGSPFLHFWSLAVEEQFYVVWPFVVIGVGALLRRRRPQFLPVLAVVAAVGLVVSLVGAGFAVQEDPARAFFMPWWRAYQLLLGALVAMWIARGGRVPRWRPAGIDVVALARLAVLAVLVVMYAVPSFYVVSPSPWSLAIAVPVALVLATPGDPARDPLSRWGGWRPLAWVATTSYVLYLWHWPVWVLLRVVTTVPGWVLVVAAFLASGVLAWATHRWVEVPLRDGARIRHWPNWRTIAVGVTASAVTAVALGGVARALPLPRWQELLKPPLTSVKQDGSPDASVCFVGLDVTDVTTCERGPAGASKTVMLVGDSHAIQWQGGFVAAAQKDGFRLITATKQSCPVWDLPVASTKLQRTYTECATWRQNLFALIAQTKPDVLVLASTTAWTNAVDANGQPYPDPSQAISAAVTKTLGEVMPDARTTVVLGDNPVLPGPPGSCLGRAAKPSDCDFTGDPHGRGLDVVRTAAAAAGATNVDTFPHLCPDPSACSLVDGRIVIYRDTDHVTNTYAGSQGPWFSEWLKPML